MFFSTCFFFFIVLSIILFCNNYIEVILGLNEFQDYAEYYSGSDSEDDPNAEDQNDGDQDEEGNQIGEAPRAPIALP